MIIAKIYTLFDPINNTIFYVGLTNEPRIKSRLTLHLCEARRNPLTLKNVTINNIINAGCKPIIEIVEEIPIPDHDYTWYPIWQSQKIETYWIEQFVAWGYPLTNYRKNPRFRNRHN